MLAREIRESNLTILQPRRSVLESIRRRVLIAFGVVAFLVGAAQLDDLFGGRQSDGGPVTALRARLDPFHLVNSYGLFAVMTTTRPELTVEGSLDGIEWRAYRFKYKPGPLDQAPAVVPFHMPRLDWQMWFAGLQERNPPRWLEGFARRLFERSPQVIGLLANDPFPNEPPRYVRIMAADYRFTNAAMRRNSGQWWLAHNRRFYLPVMAVENVAPPPAARR
jgi:hypothetical protein